MITYRVRVLTKEGKVVEQEIFKRPGVALAFAKDHLEHRNQIRIRKIEVEDSLKLSIRSNWGNVTHRVDAPRPIKTLVIHHSVTLQLSPKATIAQEKEQMRAIQSIGFARGLGGFPYGYAIFPSGRIYTGSGFGEIEAATGGFNTPTDSVVFVGNYSAFKPTQKMWDSLVDLGNWAQDRGFFIPRIEVEPHRAFKATECPGNQTIGHLTDVERLIRRG